MYKMCKKSLVIIFVIFIIISIVVNQCNGFMQVHHQSENDKEKQHEISNDKMDQIKIPKDQTLLIRYPSNTLLKYTAYKDVSILHFRIPPDTRNALFTFKAYEESKSAFQRNCKPRDITLHLKAGSYPVISPENITFPRNFLNADQRFEIYNLVFKSDSVQQRISVDGPQAGNWFAVAFISWTDPSNDRIEQQGLTTSCDTQLLAEMSVSSFVPIILSSGQIHNGSLTSTNDTSNTSRNNSNPLFASKSIPTSTSTTSTSSSTTSSPLSSSSSATFTTTSTTKSTLKSTPIFSKNSTETIYTFYVPRNVGVCTARITIPSVCLNCPDVEFYVQANALPTDANYIHSTIIKPNQTGEISFQFYVQSSTWHTLQLKFENMKGSITSPTSSLSSSSSSSLLEMRNKIGTASAAIAKSLSMKIVAATIAGMENPFKLTNNDINQNNRSNQFSPNDGWIDDPNTEYERLMNSSLYGTNDANEYQLDYSLQIDFHPENEPEAGNPAGPEKPVVFRDIEFYPLLRQTYREFFMFDYDLIPDENGTVPTVLNLTAGTPAGFRFDVGDVYDIGGTLSFAVSMKHDIKAMDWKGSPFIPPPNERSGILAEKLIGRPVDSKNDNAGGNENEVEKPLPRSNQTIIVCVHLGEPGEPKWPDKCRYGRKILPASSIVNNTDSNTSTGLIHVPFPESGQWYVTMGLYCHGAETAARITIIDSVKEFVQKYSKMLETMRTPCACGHLSKFYQNCIDDRKCLASMNETETLKVKECMMDSKCTDNYIEMTKKFEIHHKFATEQHFATDNCNTSVVFTISSSPCVAGRCGRYGRCYHYMSSGFVFSTCVCMKGYRGWDCTEDSQVPSSFSILIASLLLTLSNLLFIPSIYFAIRRKYQTEAVIYFFAMFFSIFYHACDSGEDEYSFCLVKIGVLQFCDFYCGLLAIWVTLVAMAHLRPQYVSLLHMFGAILLAFGTELNKQSLWVFLAPALTGICIISVSWSLRCRKTRNLFPARKYLTIYMPMGAVLVMVGLVCYAFLQTKQNYHIVHSIWHMVMALSILCLLPSRKSFIPKC